MEAAAAKSKLDRYVMLPAALFASQRSFVMPWGVTPGSVVVGAADPPAAVVAVVVAAAAVVPTPAVVELSLPHAPSSTTASTAAAAGARRRDALVMGPPGSGPTSCAGVLGTVPAQR